MKARNKKTGEVVTSFVISKEWGTASYIDSANTLRFSTPIDGEWEIIDESETVDWSSFRREAAKAAMEGILASGDDWSLTLAEGYQPAEKHSYPIGIARFAIACADELINQLKEGKA